MRRGKIESGDIVGVPLAEAFDDDPAAQNFLAPIENRHLTSGHRLHRLEEFHLGFPFAELVFRGHWRSPTADLHLRLKLFRVGYEIQCRS